MLDEKQLEIVNSNEPRIIVEAGGGSGKALLNGSKVVTPKGYVNIEELKINDEIFGIDGNIYNVCGVFPQGKKNIYKIKFSDGTIIKCSKDHLWNIQTSNMRRKDKNLYMTKTLEDIIKEIPLYKETKEGYKEKNVYIPLTAPLKFKKQELPIKPYTMGALLGNGYLRTKNSSPTFSSVDKIVLERLNSELSEINCELKHIKNADYILKQINHTKNSKFSSILRNLKLNDKHSWDKFIPKIYLFSNIEDRLALLQGLIDTDGNFSKSAYEYTTISKQLAEDVKFLAQSLGLTVKISTKKNCKYKYNDVEKQGKIAYRLRIKTSKELPFINYSKNKIKKINKFQCFARKYIVDIEKTNEFGEMTCIKTTAPDELFLTDGFTATHNTRCLIERIKRLLNDGIEPQNIVAITFTNMAAEEMKERLVDVPGIGDCFIGTIHSFANKIFKNSNENYKLFTQEIQDQFMSVLISIYAKHLTMERYLVYKDLKKKFDLGLVSEDEIDNMMMPSELYELRIFLGDNEDDNYPENIKTLSKKHNVITFDELLKKTTQYFKEINGKVEYLFVDEFQDIGPLEKNFFISLNADNYFYIGDEKQAIYAFKGGNVNFFLNLIRSNNWKTYYLNNNYRCGEKIIDLANEVICQADDIINVTSICKSGKTGYVTIDSKHNLKKYLSTIKDYKDWFILVRTNKDLIKLEKELYIEHIPFVSFRKGEMTLEQMRECMSQDKIKLLTIHTSKGLESPNVLLWGNFPIKQKPYLRNNDEIKVLYVGITRAIDRCIILN